MREVIGAQGEVKIYRVDQEPNFGNYHIQTEKDNRGRHIISHSEKGHHHVLPADVMVMERTKNVPDGMRILEAIVKEPTALTQSASEAHGKIDLGPGIYEFRISREFNPFLQEARRVAD